MQLPILILLGFTMVNLIILGLTLKLYTEFIKEKKYRV